MKPNKPKHEEQDKPQATKLPKAATISTPAGSVRVDADDFIKLCLDMAQGIKTVSQIRKAIAFIDEAEAGKPVELDRELAGWIVAGFQAARFLPGVVLSRDFREAGYLEFLDRCEKIQGGSKEAPDD